MRQGQKELIQDYLTEIDQSKNKTETLYKIIKKEKRTWISALEWLLASFVVLFFIWGSLNGLYQDKIIRVDCQGKILDINGQTNTHNLTLKDFNLEVTQKNDTTNKPTSIP